MNNNFNNTFLLFKRLGLAYLTYVLCRVLFIAFNPSFIQNGFGNLFLSFYYGFRFDASAIIYTNSLFIILSIVPHSLHSKSWFQTILKTLFIVINTLAITVNLADIAYVKFSGKRSGLEVFNTASDFAAVLPAYIKDYWYLFLMLAALVLALVKIYPKEKSTITISYLNLKSWLIFILVLALCFIGARGSFGLLPLNTFDAARLLNNKMVPVVVNTPFNMLMSVQQQGLKKLNFYTEENLAQIYSPIHHLNSDNQLAQTDKPNIVLIIVESLGKEYVGALNNYAGYTPFLDSLIKHSLVYKHAYANGKKSIEGIPSIMAGLPSLMQFDYISSYYQANQLNSIGHYLNKLNYKTSFYHGGKNGTMGFDNFLAISNNGNYFGLNQYPNKQDFDDNWGIFDEPYLQYFAEELNKYQEPFFSTVFTLSSHHPYSIPKHLENKFSAGTLPIHKSVRYTDYALQQFFETAKKTSWYKNTIFYITADHSAENEFPYYQTSAGKFEIPLIKFNPRLTAKIDSTQFIEGTYAQSDIINLILRDIPYSGHSFSFCSNQKQFAIQYTDGYYQLIQWPWVYQLSADNYQALGLYNLKSDSLMQINLLNTTTGIGQHLDSLTKGIIQQYNNRLIENNTRVKN